MIEITGQHLINGRWKNLGNDTFSSANPATDVNNDYCFFEATSEDAEQAVVSAAGASKQVRRLSAIQRADFLEAIASEIELLGAQLVEVAMSETALPQMRIEGERGRTCGQLRMFASKLREPTQPLHIDLADSARLPMPKADSRLNNVALGPVVVFGASNFPLAFSTAGGDTASALAAGCPVIVKGHPAHPATTELVSHAINKAIISTNMPVGIFSMVQSSAPEIAQQLVQADAVKAVAFTGSQKVGDILNKLAQSRVNPVPFFGELGSINPQFILPALLATQANTLAANQVASMLMGHGQFCTSPGVVVVTKGAGLDALMATLKENITSAGAGTMLTRAIAQTYQQKLAHWTSHEKLNLIGLGQEGQGQCQTPAALFDVSASDYLSDVSLQEELFGPAALVVVCDNSEQMQLLAQTMQGQLTASIHGTVDEIQTEQSLDLIDDISQHVGRVIFNQMPTGVEVCHSMQHGGPYPASTAPQTTSVGSNAINRFTRPVCWQNMPSSILPSELQDNAASVQIVI
ncbi:MAG: aldehyde dehydrogenase (NADP(+)) [Psychrobium sp.]|nr:aldehyde dehydrogenase (NADP(+)) [Psychrobium sp.]